MSREERNFLGLNGLKCLVINKVGSEDTIKPPLTISFKISSIAAITYASSRTPC